MINLGSSIYGRVHVAGGYEFLDLMRPETEMNELPEVKIVSLSRDAWENLKNSRPQIEKALQSGESTGVIHLADKMYISVSNHEDNMNIHLRKWLNGNLSNRLYATKDGLTFGETVWMNLMREAGDIDRQMDSLAGGERGVPGPGRRAFFRHDSSNKDYMDCKLTKAMAKYLQETIEVIVKERCNGCGTNHPSPSQHECMSMVGSEKLLKFLDEALERVDCVAVMDEFINSLADSLYPIHPTHVCKYEKTDLRALFRTRLNDDLGTELERVYDV